MEYEVYEYNYSLQSTVYSIQYTTYSINYNPNKANTTVPPPVPHNRTNHTHRLHQNPPIPIPQQGSLQQQQQQHQQQLILYTEPQYNTTQHSTAEHIHIHSAAHHSSSIARRPQHRGPRNGKNGEDTRLDGG